MKSTFHRSLTRFVRLPLAVLMIGLLSGCYLPVRFDAEVEILRTGHYNIVYDGYIADILLYDQLQKRKLTLTQEREKVKLIEVDLKRDSATKEFKYFKNGIFKINWQKKGDLTRVTYLTFIRRNENILSLEYDKKRGLIKMRGRYIKKPDAKKLYAMGLNMEGQLRVKTSARVISHNATLVKNREGREKLYIWDIVSLFDKGPKLDIDFR